MTFKLFFKHHWDEIAVYLAAFGGCLVSSNFEAFKVPGELKLDFSVGRLVIAAFLAFAVTLVQEFIPPLLETEEKARTKAGKKKNLARRFFFAIVFGLGSPRIVDMVVSAFSGVVGG